MHYNTEYSHPAGNNVVQEFNEYLTYCCRYRAFVVLFAIIPCCLSRGAKTEIERIPDWREICNVTSRSVIFILNYPLFRIIKFPTQSALMAMHVKEIFLDEREIFQEHDELL